MNTPRSCNVLMLYPLFVAESFWSFSESCKLMGVRRPAAPLGLITVAAMLPDNWTIRLIDCNTASVTDDDFVWADLVFTGGMLPQQADTLRMIEVTRAVLADAAEAGGPFLRTLDAVHLVAAGRISSALSAFLTYDKKLAAAAQEAGLPALSPA